jgi:2-polyprenyl-6-methoxyphenol hydroxylase-like FAD-dependent oxidoreductase
MHPSPSTIRVPDVAIVGGGVAGSALAIVLRRAGAEVDLIERAGTFRDRIRGETIHPWGVNELRRLDLYDLVVDQAEAQPQLFWQRFMDREAQAPYRWADDFPNAPNGLGFSHVELQHTLLEEARRLGTVVHRPASVTFARAGDAPVLTIETGIGERLIHPRLMVGADGEHSATRIWMGGTMVSDPPHHHIGGVLVRGLGLQTDRIYQSFFEGGFVFASPQVSDVARLYLVCASPVAMAIQASANPAEEIVERFRAAMPDGSVGRTWERVGPAGFFHNAPATVNLPTSRDVVLIGDASGRNDPSQGHGLSLVFRDIRILSELLCHSDDWSSIPDRFHATKRDYFEVLRQHAHWNERQATETGPEIDEIKDRIARAREIDPTAGGFAAIFATGPSGLEATEDARRHFLGEDIASGSV